MPCLYKIPCNKCSKLHIRETDYFCEKKARTLKEGSKNIFYHIQGEDHAMKVNVQI